MMQDQENYLNLSDRYESQNLRSPLSGQRLRVITVFFQTALLLNKLKFKSTKSLKYSLL